MRRYIKRGVLDAAEHLKKNHRTAETAFMQEDTASAQGLLGVCQETAVLIGNTIEADAESHDAVIKILEEYCEDLYRQVTGQAEFSKKRLDAYVVRVTDYVGNHIKEQLEAVFFPYKASMWDSLESVWMAADADPACDAYVVPIPYFDKNPDGTVSAMHDEGDKFPEYVPVVSWKEYDAAVRHPDIIYIHNPYDHANKVTTVHPDFYAKELKKHTDMLVYIPYFVCMDDVIPKHFCVLPGTMYADQVIVQSEKAKETYIREFHKFEKENDCKGFFGDPETKFRAFGSPKYDKALGTAGESINLPEDWEEKIVRRDGSRRKVLLYNTSVTQLLQGKEQALKKMRSVFQWMESREDVILLWRPHPLSETTCEAMQPQMAEGYRKIAAEYKRRNRGIYDDTPDLHRAIAVSDAYYGDASSLVDLYRLTGKPIMIQDIYVTQDDI